MPDTNNAVPIPIDHQFPCMFRGCARDARMRLEAGEQVCSEHFHEFERWLIDKQEQLSLDGDAP